LNFTVTDGSIVLYSNKYNLGRLQVVNDLYFNDDISKTIEKAAVSTSNKPPVTADPSTSPAPSPSTPTAAPTTSSNNNTDLEKNLTIINATISFGIFGGDSQPPPTDAPQTPDDIYVDGLSGGTSASVPTQSGVSGGIGTIGGTSTTSAKPLTGGTASVPTTPIGVSNNIGGSIPSMPLPASSNVDLRRFETINVNLIWGVESLSKGTQLWIVDKGRDVKSSFGVNEGTPSSIFDLSEPRIQSWVLGVVLMAKNDTELYIRQDKLTWIEMLQDFAIDAGVGFPIPKDLFAGYLQLLKQRNSNFAKMINNQIGTRSPGLSGDFTHASVTLKVDASQIQAASLSVSEIVYKQWAGFSEEVNESTPPGIPKVVAQSRIFLDAYRTEATIDSTLTTWFVANGLCLLIILLFIQNVALSFMVMVTIVLILFCLGGLLFAVFRVPFGPVEALGVSIFIGLSANYS
jgi:hypothetical protein